VQAEMQGSRLPHAPLAAIPGKRKIFVGLAVVAIAAAAVLCGCGGLITGNTSDSGTLDSGAEAADADSGSPDASGAPCSTDKDCPEGLVCGYPIEDGCDAKAVCILSNCSENPAGCSPYESPCGCHGQIIAVVRVHPMYASEPYLWNCYDLCGSSAGPCVLDAGGTD
jgi:hypothetical protein